MKCDFGHHLWVWTTAVHNIWMENRNIILMSFISVLTCLHITLGAPTAHGLSCFGHEGFGLCTLESLTLFFTVRDSFFLDGWFTLEWSSPLPSCQLISDICVLPRRSGVLLAAVFYTASPRKPYQPPAARTSVPGRRDVRPVAFISEFLSVYYSKTCTRYTVSVVWF